MCAGEREVFRRVRLVDNVPVGAGLGRRRKLVAEAGRTAAAGQSGALLPTDPCADVHASGDVQRSSGLVLVTGGSGFIGSNLVELLLSLGYAVRVLDNFSTGDAGYLPLEGKANLEVVYGDIRDKAAVREAVRGVIGVFHLAAMSKVKPSLGDRV